MLRSRIRIRPSTDSNGVASLCLKYSNQPLADRLTFAMIVSRLCPLLPAESRSLYYGPIIRLGLLPTPPRGDAVTFDYRPENACLKGTRTLQTMYACRRTGMGVPAMG